MLFIKKSLTKLHCSVDPPSYELLQFAAVNGPIRRLLNTPDPGKPYNREEKLALVEALGKLIHYKPELYRQAYWWAHKLKNCSSAGNCFDVSVDVTQLSPKVWEFVTDSVIDYIDFVTSPSKLCDGSHFPIKIQFLIFTAGKWAHMGTDYTPLGIALCLANGLVTKSSNSEEN
ncbi:hypothetical protein BC835DRAFT_1310331 [Cytidiella melzeri]|nr:hypothetical protein BC835DRAFT_1310331 [Cytidiella melzeri]